MKAMFTIMIKDLRVRFASPATLVFFLVLPLVFTAILAGTGTSGSARQAAPLVLVRDRAQTPDSRAIAALLERMPDTRVRGVTDPAEILRSSEPDLLVSIEPPGESPHVRLRLSPWKNAGETARRVGTWLASGGTADVALTREPARAPASDTGSPTATISGPSGAATGNAGQIITWVLVPLLGMGATFIAERRSGTLRRALVAPIPRGAITAGTVAAEVMAALVQIALLAVFGAVAFGLPWLAHPLELAALSVAFCCAGASLGALLGSFCRTQRQAGSLGLSVALVLAVFGGCWYPASLFPAGLRAVTRLDPAGWAMDGFLAVLGPGDAGGAWRAAGLLAACAVAALLLTIARGRLRRNEPA
jgi:ABC-2 type transport system permease protein